MRELQVIISELYRNSLRTSLVGRKGRLYRLMQLRCIACALPSPFSAFLRLKWMRLHFREDWQPCSGSARPVVCEPVAWLEAGAAARSSRRPAVLRVSRARCRLLGRGLASREEQACWKTTRPGCPEALRFLQAWGSGLPAPAQPPR